MMIPDTGNPNNVSDEFYDLHSNAGSTPEAQQAAEAAVRDDDQPERLVFEGVHIRSQTNGWELDRAEQDEAGWWFESCGRPTFVPHHAVDYIQFTAEDA